MKEREFTEKVEALARKMPSNSLEFEVLAGNHGEVRIAYGPDDKGTIHGLWACRDMAVPGIEFKSGTSRDMVRQALVMFADQEIEWLKQEGFPVAQ